MKRCMASSAFHNCRQTAASVMASAIRPGIRGLPIADPSAGIFEQTGPLAWRALGMTGTLPGMVGLALARVRPADG